MILAHHLSLADYIILTAPLYFWLFLFMANPTAKQVNAFMAVWPSSRWGVWPTTIRLFGRSVNGRTAERPFGQTVERLFGRTAVVAVSMHIS